jgi:excisionase family DNA binding protein
MDNNHTTEDDPNATALPKKLLRVTEVGRCLAVSRSFVYQLMDRGELPYVKIGKSRRVRPEDVARLIENATIGPPK